MKQFKSATAAKMARVDNMTIQRWVEDYQPYITTDEDMIQRIFEPWDKHRISSYMTKLITGNAINASFLIADLQRISDHLSERLMNVESDAQRLALQENLAYFTSHIKNGKRYLLIDGAHRNDVIERTFAPKDIHTILPFPDDCDAVIADTDNNLINIAGKMFSSLSDDLKQFIYSQPLNVVMITSGSIKDLQDAFVTGNMGLTLFPMELRICTMTDTSRFIRHLHKQTEIHEFFRHFAGFTPTGQKSRTKKADFLLLNYVASYYYNKLSDTPNVHREHFSNVALDTLFHEDVVISNRGKKILETALYDFCKGSLDEYRVKGTDFKIKMTWSDFLNYVCFHLHLITGQTNKLKMLNKKVVVNKNREKELVHEYIKMVATLRKNDMYVKNAAGDPIPEMRIDPVTRQAIPALEKDGTPKYVENEHGFARRDSNSTANNFGYKMKEMAQYFDTHLLEKLSTLHVITLVDNARTVSDREKRDIAIFQQDMIDVFTGKALSFGDVDTARTAKVHVDPYRDGYSEQRVGDATQNLRSKSNTVYSI